MKNWLVEWGKIVIMLHVQYPFQRNVFHVVCQTTMWNFQFWGSDDIWASSGSISSILFLHENHSFQAGNGAVQLFCTTLTTWNNYKTLNPKTEVYFCVAFLLQQLSYLLKFPIIGEERQKLRKLTAHAQWLVIRFQAFKWFFSISLP